MSSFFLLGIVYCTHTLSHTHKRWHTHSGAQAGAGLRLWCPSCQVVLLLPGTCHRGDGWLHHQCSPEGNGTLKERNHLSSLSSAYFSDGRPPLFFCPPHPPSSPLLRLLCRHQRHPLSSKTWKMKWNKVWQIHCFKSSWECHSRLRAQDITTAFPLTSIQIWRGVSESCFYDGVLQWEQKEICSLFSL